MSVVWLIAKREVQGYLLSPLGYVIIACLLLLDGLAFNGIAMAGEKQSYDVMEQFFFFNCGFVAAAAVLFSMRLFAEEKQQGTIVLLQSSPASDVQLVLGKYLGGLLFLSFFTALTAYMPLLVLVNGKVTWGHFFVGYLGLFLLGAAVMAVGTMASAMAKNQLLAAIISGALVVALFLCWVVARKVEGPLGDVVGFLDLYDQHFRGISRGILKGATLTYFAALTYLGLLAATLILSARRWRA